MNNSLLFPIALLVSTIIAVILILYEKQRKINEAKKLQKYIDDLNLQLNSVKKIQKYIDDLTLQFNTVEFLKKQMASLCGTINQFRKQYPNPSEINPKTTTIAIKLQKQCDTLINKYLMEQQKLNELMKLKKTMELKLQHLKNLESKNVKIYKTLNTLNKLNLKLNLNNKG